MNLAAFAAVGAGAACGAWLRWGLGLWLNPVFALVPLGTLMANLLGGFLMGVVLAAVQAWPTMSPALKLLLTTGLLGGLATFSTFSAESFHLLQRGASDPAQRARVQAVEQAAPHLSAIVDDLLDLARGEGSHLSLRSRPLRPPTVLDEVAIS